MSTQEQMELKRRALMACRDKYGDVIPELVVAAAKEKTHILHPEFDWNDRTAAHAHRIDRAQTLIRVYKLQVILEDKKFSAPFFVSNPSRSDSAYRPVSVVAKNEAMSKAVLLDELRRIESAINRARSLAIAFDMSPYFDRMLEDLIELKGRLAPLMTAEEMRASAS